MRVVFLKSYIVYLNIKKLNRKHQINLQNTIEIGHFFKNMSDFDSILIIKNIND